MLNKANFVRGLGAKMSKSIRCVKPLGALLALTLLTVTLAACNTAQVYWAVSKFARHGNEALAATYSPTAALTARLPEELRQAVGQRNHDHLLLQAAYGPTNYAFRFVQNHVPNQDHEALMARLDEIYAEGIDTNSYDIDHAKKLAATLVATQQKLAALQKQDLDIPAEEKSELRTALLEANATELSPAGIVTFAAQPANATRFPKLHSQISELAKLAAQRDQAETELELLDAANFFRLTAEMGVPQNELVPTWEASKGNMAATLKQLTPTILHYRQLVDELARYRQLAQQKQILLDKGKSAREGSSGEFVRQIQEHLKLTGYWKGPLNGVFDAALKEAVTIYQTNHQLAATGTVGAETIGAFNVPFSTRVKRIKVGLHQLRRSKSRGVPFFVWVNVGAQLLEVFDQNGSIVTRRHKVIVGQRVVKNNTPEVSAMIKSVVFYPPWNVPQRIIREEMLPEFQANPNYFAERGYRFTVSGSGETARVTSVTQPPGPGNALGVVKILFPNPFDVYLHDTPKKFLFAQTVRTFSHGCMRLQNAVDLAQYLLEHDGAPEASKVEEILKKRQSLEIPLKTQVPVFVEYTTTSADQNGLATFYLDIYGRETELLSQVSPF